MSEGRARLFDIKRHCSDDGPGIRTTVFFKGCPLSCAWCHNPEGLTGRLSLRHRARRCHPATCGQGCLAVCSQGALRLEAQTLILQRRSCNRCDACFAHCPNEAIAPAGFELELAELLYRVTIDRSFYRASGGGVTVSGGEPTLQMGFLGHFLAALRGQGISTAVETCGFFRYPLFAQKVLPFVDRIYYDLKIIRDEDHRHFTGRSNRRILENLRRLARQSLVELVVRVPLIPEVTATPGNLAAIGGLLRALGIPSVILLPCNPSGRDSYGELGLATPLPLSWMEEAALDACRRALVE